MKGETTIFYKVILAFFLLCISHLSLAGPGACDNVSLDRYRTGINGEFDKDGALAIVLNQDAQVFDQPGSSNVVTTTRFNQLVTITEEEYNRVQVEIRGSKQSGWMDKKDVLCRLTPLLDEKSQVERKAYIRTETSWGNNSAAGASVKAYQDPFLTKCSGNGCRTLSRFELYFVVDSTDNAVLLSGDFFINDHTNGLVGWVSKDNVIPWNTALGIRPKEDLKRPGADPNSQDANDDGTICIYSKPEPESASNPCQVVQGGKRWYKLPVRLPVIEHENGMYKVAASFRHHDDAAVGQQSGNQITIANYDNTQSVDDIESDLLNVNNLDVFFLIDGTTSMEEWLEAIVGTPTQKGVVQQIKESLQEKTASGVNIRFGFRLFTDTTVKDKKGLGVGFSFPNTRDCKLIDTAEIEKNHNIFQRNIAEARTTTVKTYGIKEDYSENLYGGLKQTIRDISSCPGNSKLIFVIGDAGYSSDAQRGRKITPVIASDLYSTFNRTFNNTLMFFIRTPALYDNSPYQNAWNNYKTQANVMSRELALSKGADPDDFFIQLNRDARATQDMLDKITSKVNAFANPDVVNEIVLDIRGGAALNDAISRLQTSDTDIPIFYRMLQRAACKDTPAKCSKQVYEKVNYFYVKDTEQITQDVWMTYDSLNQFKNMLQSVATEDDISKLIGAQGREILVNSLMSSLSKILRTPVSWTDEPFETYFQKRIGAVPDQFKGPLFGYSPMDLSGYNSEIDACEIRYLLEWLSTSYQSIGMVMEGRVKPSWQAEPYTSDNCVLSSKGQKVPFVPFGVDREPLGTGSQYSYKKKLRKGIIYWVPKHLLP